VNPCPNGSFLAQLPDDDRAALLEAGRPLRVPAGASLLFEGDLSGRVIVLLAGTARVFATAANGRQVLVTIVGPGEILGEMAALDGRPHSASVTASEPIEAVVIPSDRFLSIMAEHATIASAVAGRLSHELRHVTELLVQLEAFDVPTRVAAMLVDLHDRLAAGDEPFEVPISQRELGECCGASREAVTKTIATFRERGWVRTERRSIVILDVEALRRRVA
jgi:CRP/FNR family cyclic AMP-dependent transcriptional regulator